MSYTVPLDNPNCRIDWPMAFWDLRFKLSSTFNITDPVCLSYGKDKATDKTKG